MLKIGIFGVGHLGKFHIKNWKEIDHVEIIGFFDPNDAAAKEVESQFGLKRYTDMHALIDDADAIDVVTPTQFHYETCEAALIGKEKGIVMDGRDIGTAVFPEAELKIFMTADTEVRVMRRFKELAAKNPSIQMEDVRSNLAQRDHMDSTREVSPLRKADDAIVLDNSHMTPEEQLGLVLQWASEKINA